MLTDLWRLFILKCEASSDPPSRCKIAHICHFVLQRHWPTWWCTWVCLDSLLGSYPTCCYLSSCPLTQCCRAGKGKAHATYCSKDRTVTATDTAEVIHLERQTCTAANGHEWTKLKEGLLVPFSLHGILQLWRLWQDKQTKHALVAYGGNDSN